MASLLLACAATGLPTGTCSSSSSSGCDDIMNNSESYCPIITSSTTVSDNINLTTDSSCYDRHPLPSPRARILTSTSSLLSEEDDDDDENRNTSSSSSSSSCSTTSSRIILHSSKPQHEQLMISSPVAFPSLPPTLQQDQQQQQQQQQQLSDDNDIGSQAVSIVEKEFKNIIEQSPYLKEHYYNNIPVAGIDKKNIDNNRTNNNIALFHRSEIIIGRCLGQGGFANVYEIIEFQLKDDDNDDDQLTVHQQQLRIQYANDCIDKQTGRAKYAIKYVKERLLVKQQKQKQKIPPPTRQYQHHHHRASSSQSTPPDPLKLQQQHLPQQEEKEEEQNNDNNKNRNIDRSYPMNDFHNAVVDLAVEVGYMISIQHDNIMEVRGLPINGLNALQDGKHDSYFIILDCLQIGNTLEQRIYKDWTVRYHMKCEKEHFFSTFITPSTPTIAPSIVHNTTSIHASTAHHNNNNHIRRHSHHGYIYESFEHHHDNIHANDDSLQQKVQYALQLANAIEYLHSKDIIFRDLKPHNIGFATSTTTASSSGIDGYNSPSNNSSTDDGKEKIVLFDFGLCRELPKTVPEKSNSDNNNDDDDDSSINKTKEKVFWMSGVGTRRYMAPEIILTSSLIGNTKNTDRKTIKNDDDDDENFDDQNAADVGDPNNLCKYNLKADVYSWSMVFWEMLTLSKPYPGYSCEQHMIHVCQNGERPPLFNSNSSDNVPSQQQIINIPIPIQQILKSSWEADIDKRFTMKQVCEALSDYLRKSTTVTSAHRHSMTTMASRSSSSSRSSNRRIHDGYHSFDYEQENNNYVPSPPPLLISSLSSTSYACNDVSTTSNGLTFPASTAAASNRHHQFLQVDEDDEVVESIHHQDNEGYNHEPSITPRHFAFYLNLPSVPLPETNCV